MVIRWKQIVRIADIQFGRTKLIQDGDINAYKVLEYLFAE